MIYQQNTATDNPQIRLPLQGLIRRVRSDQAEISNLLDAIESTQRLFRARSAIYREQCEYTRSILRLVLVPIHDLLATTERLPIDLELHRTPLISELHKAVNTTRDLDALITHYPLANHSSSHPTVAQRWDIQCKFDQLIEGCNDVLQQANRLLDIARFPNTL